ncbi:DNA replication licensing factor MCM2 [Artemisia annua]|uniref:DNA helicase n=1 Tax=Artemisia annua TaxID=35608 RepID=A0A2U1MMD9_ARTAN|nr:DNA replication licensing factor MCM2 [Artemisia annua]
MWQPIPQDMLKKYITYAWLNVFPTFTIPEEYKTQLRASVPAPVKQLKSLERLAKAHARMHLREEVNSEDFVAALRVLSVSFISSQKLVAQECLVKALASLDDYLLFANVLQ